MSYFLESNIVIPESQRGDPAWVVATLFPPQGEWSEEAYFELETNHFIELVDGYIEVLPMPTWLHQRIVAFLHKRFVAWDVSRLNADVLFAPLPIKVFPGTIREPDILVVQRPVAGTKLHRYPQTVLLVVEVISEGAKTRHRDLVEKPADYARAGIPEYWIVDVKEKAVTILTLEGTEYREHGCFTAGRTATSVLLTDFSVHTDEIWALEVEG